GHAGTLCEHAAHEVTGAFGRDHEDVDVAGRSHLAEVDVETVGKQQGVARLEVGGDAFAVHLALGFVGQEDHYQVTGACGVRDFHDAQAGGFRFGPAARALAESDDDVHTGVLR